MSNVCAAIGRGQMIVLNERIKKRREIFYKYKELLQHYPGVSFQNEPEGMFSNRWLTTILLDTKQTPNRINTENIRLALESDNIESRPLWKPMHLQPVFKNAPFYGDETSNRLFRYGLCMPSGSNMTDEEFERIVKRILLLFK